MGTGNSDPIKGDRSAEQGSAKYFICYYSQDRAIQKDRDGGRTQNLLKKQTHALVQPSPA